MRRNISRYYIWILAAFLAQVSFAMAGEEPRPLPYQPHSVADQAWQLTVDSGTLAHAALVQRYHSISDKESTIRNLENMHQAAQRLYDQLSRPIVDTAGTVDVYLVLREAYDHARPAFDVLDDTGPVRTAVWRIRDTIRDVARYYYHEVVVPLQTEPPPETPPVNWKLRQIAADIARQATHLASTARELQLIGQVSKGDAERFFELGDSAERFYTQVIRLGNDPAGLERDYRCLVLRMQGARDVVGDFKLDFQQSLGAIWTLADQLYKLSPETPLGNYRLEDFNR